MNHNKGALYASIAAISFLQGLQFSVSPVLGEIQARYPDISVSLVQMLITAPALLSMAVALVSGWLVLRLTKKQMLLFAALIAAGSGLAPLLADSFWLLFWSRLIYGIGLGIATTMNVAVVAEFFEGQERVQAMGFQAASVGTGMVIVTTGAGLLGSGGLKLSYLINLLAVVCLLVLWFCLPETGTAKAQSKSGIRITAQVLQIDLFAMLEFFFLITFTTNIAMHLSGELAGSSSISGALTGVFSATQIVVGILLGVITRRTGVLTLPAAMFSFVLGAVLLVCFPANAILLALGAVFCGISQGMFVPTAATNISNVLPPEATALGSATLTCAMNLGQLISPLVLNPVSAQLWGEAGTGSVYRTAAIGMALAAAAALLWKRGSKS